MDAVNLLPLEYKTRSKKRATPANNLDSRKTLRTGGLAAVALVLLLGALYGYERSVVNSKKSALAKDQAALAEIKPKADAIKQAQASAEARLTVISSVSSSRMNWDKALNDFARIVPTDSFLTSLAFDAPVQTASVASPTAPSTATPTDTSTATPTDTAATTAATPAPSTTSTLTVSGTAPGTVGVARVLDRLALIPWLSDVTLGSATRSGDNGGDAFNITATVSQEP
jgi:Tfp pilus assembly protein PilN